MDRVGRAPSPVRAAVLWSGGKDAAWALHQCRLKQICDPVALLTTYNAATGRVPVHEVPLRLIELQAAALHLPLIAVPLPPDCPNAQYEAELGAALARARDKHGIAAVVAGDLFLADVRDYRAALLARCGLELITPLWGRDTAELAAEIAGSVSALVVAIDRERLPLGLLGRTYDRVLLAELSPGVDPCGENGEFHTFVTAMSEFSASLAVKPGAVVDAGRYPWIELG